MAIYKIPLTPVQQEFDIDLGATTYHIRLYYNKFMEAWCLDLMDADKVPLSLGQPLVTGANILEQLRYKGIGGVLVLHTDGDHDHMPTLTELGDGTNLYFITEKVSE